MLSNLRIENIAIIESAGIEFTDGFGVLSGETGAGKSIIIDSLSAVLGERASKDLIRTGAEQAQVTALFQGYPEGAKEWLRENDIPEEPDGSLLIQRTLRSNGRNTCKVNGMPVTVTLLGELGKELISIHGQHDSQKLLNPDEHVKYIDLLGGLEPLRSEYEKIYEEYLSLYREYKALEKNDSEQARRMDFLEFEISEIDGAGIVPGERERLLKRREFFKDSEKIVRDMEKALSALEDGEMGKGAISLLFDTAGYLETPSGHFSELEDASGKVSEAAYYLEEVKSLVSDLILSSEYDEEEQNSVEARLSELHALSLKYGNTEEEILLYRDEAEKELEALKNRDETLERIVKELEEKKALLIKEAEKLSAERKKTAQEFDSAVKHELSFLNMPEAELKTEFTPCKIGRNGKDELEFLISPNPGEGFKPLSRIASGGELSRIMLAIQSVLSGEGGVPTFIFDEIDTGVSGSAAERIAEKLKSVSKNHQVLCITHSPQVASYADTHYLIRKETVNGKTYTRVEELDKQGRVEEIARIIGGERITELQKQSALEMIERIK